MQRRVLTWLEIAVAFLCFGVAAWPATGMCAGRPLGYDCESWFIFGVNVFAPVGVASLVCGVWSVRSRSLAPHFVLGAVSLALLGRFLLAGLI